MNSGEKPPQRAETNQADAPITTPKLRVKKETWGDALKRVKMLITGNRYVLLCHLGGIATIGAGVEYIRQFGFETADDAKISSVFIACGISFSAVGMPFSAKTRKIYETTKRHIRDFGTIDPDYFKVMMGIDLDNWTYGYCQLQGMYLAAKEMGCLDQFHSLKKKYTTNVLPNF
jgi:hypothetical protein